MQPPHKPPTQQELNTMFCELEITNFHERMNNAQGYSKGICVLNEIKKEAKENFKRLAMKKHPDRYPEREEEFKKLSAAYDCIKELNLKPIRRLPQFIRFIHTHINTTTTSTTTGTTTNFGPTIWIKTENH